MPRPAARAASAGSHARPSIRHAAFCRRRPAQSRAPTVTAQVVARASSCAATDAAIAAGSLPLMPGSRSGRRGADRDLRRCPPARDAAETRPLGRRADEADQREASCGERRARRSRGRAHGCGSSPATKAPSRRRRRAQRAGSASRRSLHCAGAMAGKAPGRGSIHGTREGQAGERQHDGATDMAGAEQIERRRPRCRRRSTMRPSGSVRHELMRARRSASPGAAACRDSAGRRWRADA